MRLVLIASGSFLVALAALGVVLPGLPTTPFLILASACFIRSSPALHQRLLSSRVFGPFLKDWQQHRGVRPRVKVIAILVLLAVVTTTVVWSSLPWPVLAVVVALALVGLVVVVRLRVIREG